MYKYENAVCLSRQLNSQWEEKDIQNDLVADIYDLYSKVYLTLSHPALDHTVHVDMDEIKRKYQQYSGTLNELLEYNGDLTLPYVTDLPSEHVHYANYADAIYSEYKIDVTKVGHNYPAGIMGDILTDLKLTRPSRTNINLKDIHDYCLVSVNGYIHRTDGFQSGTKSEAYVYDGAVTMRANDSQYNHVGILSFRNIGKIQQVQIDKESIKPLEEDGNLRDKLTFSVEEDLTDKTCLLVLGGYLVFPEEQVFWQYNDNTFALNLKALPYLERLVESSYYLDLSSLGLTKYKNSKDIVSTEEVWSDEVIRNYMTLSQSFLAIIDIPNLIIKKQYIKNNGLPGEHTSYVEPTNPLFVGYGRMAEYWKTYEDGIWDVKIDDGWYRNFILSRQHLQLNNDHRIPSSQFYLNRGLMLEIAGFRI